MAGFLGGTRFRAQTQVETYWNALRGPHGVPKRSDIDPRGIENALEYAFILEKIAPGLARLRIAGSHLSDVMGMEVRGMPISSFISPTGRKGFAETLEKITSVPAIARLDLSAETGIGKPPLAAKMLLLPLQSDFGDINRILGCFETQGEIRRAPRRFNILRTEIVDLSDATKENARPKVSEKQPDAEGFAEPRAMFRHRDRSDDVLSNGKPRPTYLKLVKSDD